MPRTRSRRRRRSRACARRRSRISASSSIEALDGHLHLAGRARRAAPAERASLRRLEELVDRTASSLAITVPKRTGSTVARATAVVEHSPVRAQDVLPRARAASRPTSLTIAATSRRRHVPDRVAFAPDPARPTAGVSEARYDAVDVDDLVELVHSSSSFCDACASDERSRGAARLAVVLVVVRVAAERLPHGLERALGLGLRAAAR